MRRFWKFAGIGAVAVGLSSANLASAAAAAAAEPAGDDDAFLSRVTVQVPLATIHVPHDAGFNDHNWGAIVDVAVARADFLGDPELSLVGGYFTNSYYKDTAILGGAAMWLLNPDYSHVKIRGGVLLGADLNGGYRGYNSVDPLLGAAQLRIDGANFDPQYALLSRLGFVVTVIPGQDFAFNFGLSFRL